MGLAGKGVAAVSDAVNSGAAGALVPRGISSGDDPISNVMNPLGDANVKHTIDVLQAPNVTIHAPMTITGTSDPVATGNAAGAAIGRIGAQYMSRKSGALHGGTE